jgi:hypothetical protein
MKDIKKYFPTNTTAITGEENKMQNRALLSPEYRQCGLIHDEQKTKYTVKFFSTTKGNN